RYLRHDIRRHTRAGGDPGQVAAPGEEGDPRVERDPAEDGGGAGLKTTGRIRRNRRDESRRFFFVIMTEINLIDSHAHLTDDRLADDVHDVLARARAAGVGTVVTIASSVADSERTATLAREHDGVYASVGIHPHEASGANDVGFERLRELAADDRV